MYVHIRLDPDTVDPIRGQVALPSLKLAMVG